MANSSEAAVIYCRFSPRPNAAECESSQQQAERCTRYCINRRYSVMKVFQDNDMSGRTMDGRPELKKAIEYVCQGKGVLVVTSLSRLARCTVDAIEICGELHRRGANLAMLDMDIDTTTPLGRCFFTISAAFWQMEREEIANRTSVAMVRHQSRGRRMSRILPYGWQLNPGNADRMLPHDEEQRLIAEITLRRNEGDSLRTICKYLNDQRLFCRGRKWNHQTVSNILARERTAREGVV